MKYKHKTTGDVVIKDNKKNIYYFDNDITETIHSRFIENSNDWELVNEPTTPLLTTDDGVDLFDGDNFYFIYNWNISKGVISNNRFDKNNNYKHFSCREKAEYYVHYNKPIFSRQHLIDNGISLDELKKILL